MSQPTMTIKVDGDGAYPDMAGKVIIHRSDIGVTGLAGGMGSGAPSVGLRIDVDAHTVVFAETSLALFLTAADALKARYGDPRS